MGTRCSQLQWRIVGFCVGEHQFCDQLNVKARCCHFQDLIVGFCAWGKNESVEGEGKMFSALRARCRVLCMGRPIFQSCECDMEMGKHQFLVNVKARHCQLQGPIVWFCL